jgi:CHAD domain-containing protein
MSYTFSFHVPLPEEIQRVAREQAEAAIASIRDKTLDRDEAVHDVRKRFKKIRALLRLIRGETGEDFYKAENARYRDPGRRISALRDSTVHIETLDFLRAEFRDSIVPGSFEALREKLVRDHEKLRATLIGEEKVLDALGRELEKGKKRINNWPCRHEDFACIEKGLKKAYRQGRRAVDNAWADPSADAFHELRKRVKYHWYHHRLLEMIWQPLMQVRAGELKRLSDFLGEMHDISELKRLFCENGFADSHPESMSVMLALMDERVAEVRHVSRPLALRIYAEKPGAFSKRMGAWWSVRRTELLPERRFRAGISSG